MQDLKKTALTHVHEALGAKMVPFAGYLMPVQYTGVIDEHVNVRTNVGMFDGHVEALDNVKSADPSYFCPTGSKVVAPSAIWHYYVGPANSPLRQAGAIIP